MHVRQPRDLMRLMYTSGTTDRPKGVMLTYENMYWKSADQTLVLALNADTRLLVVGPLYHVGALDCRGLPCSGTAACSPFIVTSSPSGRWLQSRPRNSTPHGSRRYDHGDPHLPHPRPYDVSSLRWAIGAGERREMRIRAFSDYFAKPATSTPMD